MEGNDPAVMHQKMAATLEEAIGEIRALQKTARKTNKPSRPRWPMIEQGTDRPEVANWTWPY